MIRRSALPRVTKCYEAGSYDADAIRRNNLIVYDNIHGVSTLIEKATFEKYLKMIEGKVIYCEDHCYRLMAYDGAKMIYCDSPVSMYGFGFGISTGTNDKWAQRLLNDLKASNEVIVSMFKEDTGFNRLLRQAFDERFSGDSKRTRKFFLKHPFLMLKRLRQDKFPRSSIMEFDESFVKKVLDTEAGL